MIQSFCTCDPPLPMFTLLSNRRKVSIFLSLAVEAFLKRNKINVKIPYFGYWFLLGSLLPHPRDSLGLLKSNPTPCASLGPWVRQCQGSPQFLAENGGRGNAYGESPTFPRLQRWKAERKRVGEKEGRRRNTSSEQIAWHSQHMVQSQKPSLGRCPLIRTGGLKRRRGRKAVVSCLGPWAI